MTTTRPAHTGKVVAVIIALLVANTALRFFSTAALADLRGDFQALRAEIERPDRTVAVPRDPHPGPWRSGYRFPAAHRAVVWPELDRLDGRGAPGGWWDDFRPALDPEASLMDTGAGRRGPVFAPVEVPRLVPGIEGHPARWGTQAPASDPPSPDP